MSESDDGSIENIKNLHQRLDAQAATIKAQRQQIADLSRGKTDRRSDTMGAPSPIVNIRPRTVYDVEFPDGATVTMELVDHWPEGLVRLKNPSTGDVLVACTESPENGFGAIWETLFGDGCEQKQASVLFASPRILCCLQVGKQENADL